MLTIIGIVGLILYVLVMTCFALMLFLNMPREIAPSFEVNLSGRGVLWNGLLADSRSDGLSTGVGLARGCGRVQARQ